MINIVKEIISNMEIKSCPVCSCDRLWFKQYTLVSDNKYNVLIKCDRCAYVNTTLSNYSHISTNFISSSASYEHIGVFVCTDGRTEPADYYIGYDYWFNGSELKRHSVRCPNCGEVSEVADIRPFIRYKDNYRVDIMCRCKNNHVIAFGVHIPKEVFEVLNVRR